MTLGSARTLPHGGEARRAADGDLPWRAVSVGGPVPGGRQRRRAGSGAADVASPLSDDAAAAIVSTTSRSGTWWKSS